MLTAQSTLGPVLHLTGANLAPRRQLAVSGAMSWEGSCWHLAGEARDAAQHGTIHGTAPCPPLPRTRPPAVPRRGPCASPHPACTVHVGIPPTTCTHAFSDTRWPQPPLQIPTQWGSFSKRQSSKPQKRPEPSPSRASFLSRHPDPYSPEKPGSQEAATME